MLVSIFLTALLIYLVAGFAFGIAFVIKGVEVVDEGAHGTGWGFRLIILPGVIFLWPVLLRKWVNTKIKRDVRNNNGIPEN